MLAALHQCIRRDSDTKSNVLVADVPEFSRQVRLL